MGGKKGRKKKIRMLGGKALPQKEITKPKKAHFPEKGARGCMKKRARRGELKRKKGGKTHVRKQIQLRGVYSGACQCKGQYKGRKTMESKKE